jgi:hypothetical protein
MSKELDHHSENLSDVLLDYYCRKSCGDLEVNTLKTLLTDLFLILQTKEASGIDMPVKYWAILDVVMVSHTKEFIPKVSNYI